MKKFLTLLLAFLMIFAVGCSKKAKEPDVLHLGIDCEILEIDSEKKILVLSGIGEDEKIIGNGVKFDCADVDINMDEKFINFEDLKTGDHVAIGIYESEMEKIGNEKEVPKLKQVELKK